MLVIKCTMKIKHVEYPEIMSVSAFAYTCAVPGFFTFYDRFKNVFWLVNLFYSNYFFYLALNLDVIVNMCLLI